MYLKISGHFTLTWNNTNLQSNILSGEYICQVFVMDKSKMFLSCRSSSGMGMPRAVSGVESSHVQSVNLAGADQI